MSVEKRGKKEVRYEGRKKGKWERWDGEVDRRGGDRVTTLEYQQPHPAC